MGAAVQTDSDQSKSSISITSYIGFASARKWLTEIISSAGPGSAVEPSIEFRVISCSPEHADDEDPRALEELFRLVGFDPKQVVVRTDTINFNIHYVENSPDAPKRARHLPLYSIADIEFGVCWTWDSSSCSLRGIIWHFNKPDIARGLLEDLSRSDHSSNHVLLPALLVLQIENAAMRMWVDVEADGITSCQLQTGYHYFAAPSYAGEGAGDHKTSSLNLESMTRRISGLAVNIATSVLSLQRILQLADFILESLQDSTVELNSGDLASSIMRQTRSARRQTEGLLLEAEAWKHKSTIVVQTLLSLTTQQDQKISIGIANHSRTLAAKATRDSTSMKAIAAVTMCFLPGTFVSSLFSMPMFDWDAGVIRHVSSQFWIYWLVTLPLTIVVIAVWLLWTNRSYFTRWTSKTQEGEEEVDEEIFHEHGSKLNHA